MKISPNWVREFVELKVDDRRLGEDLTMHGIAVEGYGTAPDGQAVFEVEFTTNRPDAMNHYGVARECAAIYDAELKTFNAEAAEEAEVRGGKKTGKGGQTGGDTKFPIIIEDAQGCGRYTGRIIRGVSIKESPEWMVRRLESVEQRSINNAADASNYALWEMGHPTHAFDLDLLQGGKIIVRRAREGELLRTLDGVERKLSREDLVIADAAKPVALAGVMGGFDSMITERTKNVLIESAWFDPATVRSMAKRHGMHTDASHRFERGADYGITPLACDRVAELILASAGGELHGERVDTIGRTLERSPVPLRRSEIKRHLGIDIAADEIEGILRRLGFAVTRDATDDFLVRIPTWRLDVEREIDILEELARVYGYNKFPNTLPAFIGGVVELPDEPKNAKVREIMLALGYDEAISLTFISEEEARVFGGSRKTSASGSSKNTHPSQGAAASEPLAVANPLSDESAYMRTSLLPGLIGMIAYNLNRGTTNVRLFEAGEVFEKLGDGYDERRHLGFAAPGNAVAGNVHTTAQAYTFFHMKGDIEELLAAFAHQSLYFDARVPEYFHPGRAARAVMDGTAIAYFGQLHPEQAARRKLRQEVYAAEVMLDRLYKHELRQPRYQPISKFPAVERDFSFVFDDAVTFERIKSVVTELRLTELQSFVPAEIYRGEKVGAGKYSVLLHAEFQSPQRTLRDDEVAQWSAQIIAGLEGLGGLLRA